MSHRVRKEVCSHGKMCIRDRYYVAEHIDPANQVKGQSLMGMATTGVGSAFGNFVSGQLLDRTGVNGMLLFCTICATVGLLVVIYAVRKK